jgi:MarR family transcriptional regulator, organic hydroperoxide resistance regulator
MTASTHRLYHRLQLAAHHLRKTADRALGEAVGLTVAQTSVLSVLAREGKTSQRAVARELGLNESAVTPMVARLLRLGLVIRMHDEVDARAWSLELSEKGRDLLRHTKSAFARVNAVVDGELSDAEIRALVGYLDRLINAFE